MASAPGSTQTAPPIEWHLVTTILGTGMDRLTVAEAAEALGITQEAVRKRVQRDTIQWEKDPEGRLYVYLDAHRSGDADMTRRAVLEAKEETISDLRRRVYLLERHLEAAEERDRENRRLLAAALERVPAIEAAPSDTSPEAREAPVSASEGESSTTHISPTARETIRTEAEESRPSWWRRVFGLPREQ